MMSAAIFQNTALWSEEHKHVFGEYEFTEGNHIRINVLGVWFF